MNKYVRSETNQHTMKLIQMGADIKVISSQMVYVSFQITKNFTVSYVYNINKKNKYFIERIKPYPITVKEFNTAEDVINIIKIDVEQFRNAVKSHNIYDFITINRDFHNIILSFEDLFLYYNIEKENIDKLLSNIKEIKQIIENAKVADSRVYFKKEPEHL